MLTKYADCEIVDFQLTSPSEIRKTASFEHIPEDRFRTKDGYLYVKVRAISSRVNKNHDGWPVNELAGMKESAFRDLQKELDLEDSDTNKSSATKIGRVFTSSSKRSSVLYGYKTFIGRPIFIDHNNSDPRRARGVVVDSILHIEPSGKRYSSNDYWSSAPNNHKPETHIELLLEVDGKSFPKLAKAIKDGKVNAVSMGANVTHTICNICQKKAKTVDDYCSHIKKKGINYTRADGTKTSAYEDCYNPNFFEISFVFDPADTTALTTGPVITSSVKKEAGGFKDIDKSTKEWQPYTEEELQQMKSEREETEKLINESVKRENARKTTSISLDINDINETIQKNAGFWSDIGHGLKNLVDIPKDTLISAGQAIGDFSNGNWKGGLGDLAHGVGQDINDVSRAGGNVIQAVPGGQGIGNWIEKHPTQTSMMWAPFMAGPAFGLAGDALGAGAGLAGDALGAGGRGLASLFGLTSDAAPAVENAAAEAVAPAAEASFGTRFLSPWNLANGGMSNLQSFHAPVGPMAPKTNGLTDAQLALGGGGVLSSVRNRLSFNTNDINDMIRQSTVNLVPPEGVRAAARKGIQLHAQGKAGDGFESATLTRAHKIANGEQLTPEHVKRMHSFFERHAGGRSKTAPSGEVTPWDVAWAAWGGNAGRTWAASKVKELESSSKTSKSKCQCWDGYKRVPGTEPCAPGSCEKCDSHRKKTSSINNFSYYEGLMNKLAGKDTDLTHKRYETLREEAHCPFDIRHCGMDEQSGHCDVCGFTAPPAGLGEPNIEKAKNNLHRIEEAIEKLRKGEELDFRLDDKDDIQIPDDLESLIEEIGKIRVRHSKTLTNEQSRKFNLQTNHGKSGVMNKRSQIVLTASVETAPTAEELYSKGWDVVAATPKTPIAEDGQRATNEPHSSRIVSDQMAPVTSSFYRESTLDSSYPTPNTGANGGNGAIGTPQFHSDQTGGNINQGGGMTEHHPTSTVGTGSNHPVPNTGPNGGHVSQPQYSGGMQNSKSDPQSHNMTEHHPTAIVPASYPIPGTGPGGGNGADGTPQFHGEAEGGNINEDGGMNEYHPSGGNDGKIPQTGPKGKGKSMGGKSKEAHLFDAMKLAKLEIELGLTSPENEFNRVAALGDTAHSDVALQYKILSNVKQAGLSKAASAESRKTSMTLPSMRQVEASAPTATTSTPDEAIFG